LPLTPDAVSRAARAALAAERAKLKPIVTSAALATVDRARGLSAK
jgi:hypothetical protein